MDRRILALLAALPLLAPALPVQPAGAAVSGAPYPAYQEVRSRLVAISVGNPAIARLDTLGTTWEGRDILALRLGTEGKPAALVMGGHHAREPSSVVLPLRLAERLAADYDSNGSVRWLLDNTEIWFVPLVNPDGLDYVLSSGDWSWRKNRRPVDSDGDGTVDAIGVDLNRNYGRRWGEGTAVHVPGSLEYCGPSAFSENETRAVRDLALREDFSISMSFHAYGNEVTWPWNNLADADNARTATARALALEAAERNGYRAMKGTDLYETYGDSDDWLFGNASAYPLTFELGGSFTPSAAEMDAQFSANLPAAVHLLGLAHSPTKAEKPDWTFLVYMAADNTLADQALADLNEMEGAPDSTDVQTIVLYDGPGMGDSQIYRVGHDAAGAATLASEPIDDGGAVFDAVMHEARMNEFGTLRNFVAWGLASYPAQGTVLGIWDHGAGLLGGVCLDKNGYIEMYDLGRALANLTLDIVGFDVCYGAYAEVALELSGSAKYMVASQGEIPDTGWSYGDLLGRLAAGPNMDPRTFASEMVASYARTYNGLGYATLSAVDLPLFEAKAIPTLYSFASQLRDVLFYNYSDIRGARNSTAPISSTHTNEIDLGAFALNVAGAANVSGDTREWSRVLLERLNATAFAKFNGAGDPYYTGLSIGHPPDGWQAAYSPYDLLSGPWGGYLREIPLPSQRPVIETVSLPGADDSAGPLNVTVRVTDDALQSVLLLYRTGSSGFYSAPMPAQGNGVFTGMLPAANGSVVEYYMTAIDADGHEAQYPQGATLSGSYLSFTGNSSIDLYVSSLVVDNWTTGGRWAITATVGNSGPNLASNAAVRLYAIVNDNDILIEALYLTLLPGDTRSVTFYWEPVNGTGLFKCTIGAPPGAPPDSNPENNTFELHVIYRPDFMPASSATDYLTLALALAMLAALIILATTAAVTRKNGRERIALSSRVEVLEETCARLGQRGWDTVPARHAVGMARARISKNDFEGAGESLNEAAQLLAAGRR
ncbi:MAG: hypothetical protein HZB92_01960 [Euryarchaeota archaeon]|nr:hypothetical protein [Euryarchaeota archaeon]